MPSSSARLSLFLHSQLLPPTLGNNDLLLLLSWLTNNYSVIIHCELLYDHYNFLRITRQYQTGECEQSLPVRKWVNVNNLPEYNFLSHIIKIHELTTKARRM